MQKNDKDEELIEALRAEDLNRCKQALSNGADPNAQMDELPLVTGVAITGNAALLKALLDAGANPDVTSGPRSMTPLMHVAAIARRGVHEPVVRALLDAGADLNRLDASGKTAHDWHHPFDSVRSAAIDTLLKTSAHHGRER